MINVSLALFARLGLYLCGMETAKRTIETREDVGYLVRSFYAMVREDDFIGHFFNETITDWEEHLEKLTDFWQGNLLGIPGYKGRPPMEHIKLDYAYGHVIEPAHFGQWLNLWINTLDEKFEGPKVDIAKDKARQLAEFFMFRIYNARPQTTQNTD